MLARKLISGLTLAAGQMAFDAREREAAMDQVDVDYAQLDNLVKKRMCWKLS